LEAALPWTPRAATYADCDGDGIVDSADICPIVEYFDRVAALKRENGEALIAELASLEDDILASMYQGLLNCPDNDGAGYAAFLQLLEPLSPATPARPRNFALFQNYPNPFNVSTVISFSIPSRSHVRVDVFDILGRSVVTLLEDVRDQGYHAIAWDGTSASGEDLSSGVYLYRVSSDGHTEQRKMVLLK
jgi:hypothetical protein